MLIECGDSNMINKNAQYSQKSQNWLLMIVLVDPCDELEMQEKHVSENEGS